MSTLAALRAAVDDAFSVTAAGMEGWPDPHPDRSPLDEEYSRVTDPAKWRLLNARAEAWGTATVGLGLAACERDVDVEWRQRLARSVRIDRLVPARSGAMPLLLAYAEPEGEYVAGVTLAIGDPAVDIARAPDCGCDACDSGSDAELESLDDSMFDILTGAVRHLSRGARTITTRRNGWSASGSFRRDHIAKVLANARGWDEISGGPWLDDASVAELLITSRTV